MQYKSLHGLLILSLFYSSIIEYVGLKWCISYLLAQASHCKGDTLPPTSFSYSFTGTCVYFILNANVMVELLGICTAHDHLSEVYSFHAIGLMHLSIPTSHVPKLCWHFETYHVDMPLLILLFSPFFYGCSAVHNEHISVRIINIISIRSAVPCRPMILFSLFFFLFTRLIIRNVMCGYSMLDVT